MTDTYGYLADSATVFALAGGASTRLSAFDGAGTRISVKDGATVGYLVPDLLGSTAATEPAGATTIASAIRFDGYGRTAAITAPGGTVALDFKFSGALDLSPDASALYDIGARDYSPSSGAWTQLDTYAGSAQDPISMNRFLYAHADPTTLIDPSGHRPLGVDETPASQAEADAAWQANIRRIRRQQAGGGGGGDGHDPGPDIGAIAGPVLSGIWDSLSNTVIDTASVGVHALRCGSINAYNPISCPDFDHNVRMLTDERYRLESLQAEILGLAVAFGDAQSNLTSDDPYTKSRAVTDVLTFAALAAAGIRAGKSGWAGRGTRVARVPTASELAADVAEATAGSLRPLKSGYAVTIPYGKRNIVIRVMEKGRERENYYRISVSGKQAYAADGSTSTIPELTHVSLSETSLEEILRIVDQIEGSR